MKSSHLSVFGHLISEVRVNRNANIGFTYYRRQRSCGKVMFYTCLSFCSQTRHPPWVYPPGQIPPGQTPPGHTHPLCRYPLGQTPSLGRHPPPPQRDTPLGRYPRADTPRQTPPPPAPSRPLPSRRPL